MDLRRVQQKLLEAARTEPADERVPYAFENRIMTHIRALGAPVRQELWAQLWWRAALVSMIASLSLSVFCTAIAKHQELSLAEHLETAVYAPVEEMANAW